MVRVPFCYQPHLTISGSGEADSPTAQGAHNVTGIEEEAVLRRE